MSLQQVEAQIAAACARAGRLRDSVSLIAVTKNHSVTEITEQLYAQGHKVYGENRVQEYRQKKDAFPDIEWHFIGNLQSNKIKYCTGFSLIHSVNSEKLIHALSDFGAKKDHGFSILIELNIAAESSKQGAAVDEAKRLIELAHQQPNLNLRGLMTMAPWVEDKEQTRPVFASLRELAQEYQLEELSMGMSNDFEVAIEEGATMVRVGSAVFRQV